MPSDLVQLPSSPFVPWFASDPGLPLGNILGDAFKPNTSPPPTPLDSAPYNPAGQIISPLVPAPFKGGQCSLPYQIIFKFTWTNEYGVQNGQGRLNRAYSVLGPIKEVFENKYGLRIGCIAGEAGEIFSSPTNSNIYQPTSEVTEWILELPPWAGPDNCGEPDPIKPPQLKPPSLVPTPQPDLPFPDFPLPDLPFIPQPDLPFPDFPLPTLPTPLKPDLFPFPSPSPPSNVLIPTVPTLPDPTVNKPPVVVPTPDPTLCDIVKQCSPCQEDEVDTWLVQVTYIPSWADMNFYDSTGKRILNAGYVRIISDTGYPLMNDIPIRLERSIIMIKKTYTLEVSVSKGFQVQLYKL